MLSGTISTSFLFFFYYYNDIIFSKAFLITLIIQLAKHVTLYLGDDFYTATLYDASNKSAAAIGLPRFAARATSL